MDKEGPPGPEHDLLPVHQGEGAGELPEAPPPHMEIEVGGGPIPIHPANLAPPPGLDAPVPAGIRRTREVENVNLPSPMRRRISDASVEEPLLEPPPSGHETSSRLQPVVEEEGEIEDATPYPAEGDHTSSTPSPPMAPDTPTLPQPHVAQPVTSPEPQEPETPQLPTSTTTTIQPPYPLPHPGEPGPDVPVPPSVSQVSQARPLERTGRGRTSSRSPRRSQNHRTPAEMLPYMGSGRVAHQISEIEPPTRREESSSSTSSSTSRSDLLTSERSLSLFAHGVCEQRLIEDVDEEKWLTFLTGGWSGTIYNFILGKDDYEFEDGEWVLMAKRNGETDVKKLPEDEKKMFRSSDLAEWQSIVGTGAVLVHCGKAAQELRENHPSRILSSRMVRRKKPPWSSNMPYLVHVLFKQYYLSNVDAQNQSLFKQCNLSNVKNSKSENISKSGNEVLKNFEFDKIIFDTKNYQSW